MLKKEKTAKENVEKFTEHSVEVPIRIIHIPDTVSLRVFSQNATIRFNIGWNNYKKISREMFAAEVDYNDLTGSIRPQFLTVKITKTPEDMGITNISISPETVEDLIEKNIHRQ